MSSTTASPLATSTSHSSFSKGASIGIGVGLAIAVLLIIGALLWFFSMHKRYQDDPEEIEVGNNTTDYRRKAASIDAMPRPVTNDDQIVAIQHSHSQSKGKGTNRHEQGILEAQTETRTEQSHGQDHDMQKRREGFF